MRPFASFWFGERIGRLVKGSGGLEIMVRERRRRCMEKHRYSVMSIKRFDFAQYTQYTLLTVLVVRAERGDEKIANWGVLKLAVPHRIRITVCYLAKPPTTHDYSVVHLSCDNEL